MRIESLCVCDRSDGVELRGRVFFETHWVWGDEPFELWYRFPPEWRPWLSAENADPFLSAFLPVAMALGEPLQIEGAASPQLLQQTAKVQEILHCWCPELSRVAVEVRAGAPRAAGERVRRGLFFSLGVDSSYSLCRSLDRPGLPGDAITHLITVEGFDIYLWENERFGSLLQNVRDVAAALELGVLAVTTNLRDLCDRVVDWVRFHHGAALASVPLALGGCFGEVQIAASQTYRQLIPRGAHPLLDPLWSTEALTFFHVGLEATRMEKVRNLAAHPEVLRHLRVCATSQQTSEYNCGRCEKCLRTMMTLRLADALELCPAFPAEIDPERVRGLEIRNRMSIVYLREILEEFERRDRPGERALREALRACIDENSAPSKLTAVR